MLTVGKKQIRLYLLLTIINVVIFFLLSDKTLKSLLALILVATCAAANQGMLTKSVSMLADNATGKAKKMNNKLLIFLMIGKFAILALALVAAIQLMPNLIILPVLVYIVQLGILAFSMNKVSQ